MALDDLDGEKVDQQFLVHILKDQHWSRSTTDHAPKPPTRLFPIFTIIQKRKPAPISSMPTSSAATGAPRLLLAESIK